VFKRSQYRLLGLVGQGQFGRVFCAVHRQTGRLVALKSLDHERFPTAQFLRELRFLLSLRHPNIVACRAIEHTATGRHLVMDYCEGGTLRSLMTEELRLSVPQSLKLVTDVLEGLAHAHDRGIVHCDIKPENILLTVQPQGWTAQISDFGIARLSQAIEGRETENTGSPAYMAPERFYGNYSPTSDLYSVGILLHELLVGYRPFSGTPAELMAAHLNQSVKLPDTIPAAWQPLIATALQKLSARRFQSAKEMLLAIRAIALRELPSQRTQLPLLQAINQPPDCFFQIQHQEPLVQPARLLSVSGHSTASGSSLYRADAQQVCLTCYPTNFLAAATVSSAALLSLAQPLAEPAEELVMRPQGCFVITRRSLHCIPAVIPTATAADRHYQTLFELPQDSTMAIAPQGDWAAILTLDLPHQSYKLAFHSLASRSIALASSSLQIAVKEPVSDLPRLFALDQRHLAIASPVSSQFESQFESQSESGTLIKILTRRGDEIGSLLLPLQIEHPTLTPIPYQLLAIDRNHPELLVRIDLKPYRITRLAAGIVPDFLAATDWGYIVANRQGEISLLDLAGRQVGVMAAPAPITAIAPFEQHGLWVATWAEEGGSQLAIDLREIGADLLF
jgi:serine/threonine protein kinase